jgi:hypothetical protein
LLADGDLDLVHLPGAYDAHRHGCPHPISCQQGLEGVVVRHRLAVQGDDGIA